MLTLRKQDGEGRIFVQSEDDPQRMLLETKISRDDGYQKQQGTARPCLRRVHARLTPSQTL